MSLGGGTFTSQNKLLPGAYINFVSAARASAVLGDRGTVTMGMQLNWGIENQVFEVTSEDLVKNTRKVFGYDYTSPELAPIRDMFCNATKVYLYRLNGGGAKAANTYGTAKYCGTRGNDLKIVIQANADTPTLFDVITYLGTLKVDSQTVAKAANLINNDYVVFKTTATLANTAGVAMTGGTNGTVTGDSHSAYLAAVESYNFNVIGCMSDDATTKKLYIAFTKRMRDEVGVKFVCVLFNQAADYEGIINVKNCIDVVPWVVGAEGGCLVNRSCTNKKYDGEAVVSTNYTQTQLTNCIKAGELVLHKVNDDIRILTDINSLVTYTEDKNVDFASNQTIRVIDQIANDIANVFNVKYLGKIQNNNAGRVSLWTDIVKHHQTLNDMGAIEDFTDADISVLPGDDKKSVTVADTVSIVNAMEKLYMTVTVA